MDLTPSSPQGLRPVLSARGSYSAARLSLGAGVDVRSRSRKVFGNSLHVELQKRIASAKSGFAQFARFFQVPGPTTAKEYGVQVVVNESLLSALEVRPLSKSDENRLEQARGMLLSRILGRDGFGAIAGDSAHRSVTVASLRQSLRQFLLSFVLEDFCGCEELSAEQAGQTRLDLAAFFGSCNELVNSLNEDTGSVSSHAPRFLHGRFDSWL